MSLKSLIENHSPMPNELTRYAENTYEIPLTISEVASDQ